MPSPRQDLTAEWHKKEESCTVDGRHELQSKLQLEASLERGCAAGVEGSELQNKFQVDGS